jgi:hypothetical protein
VNTLSAAIGRSNILPEGEAQSVSTEVTPIQQVGGTMPVCRYREFPM